VSKGAEELLKLVKKLFPHQRVELEHNVAKHGALFVDIYLPRLKIGFEFDGEQHFKYCEHFHGSRENFIKAKRRDQEKDKRCEELGISLVRVAYNENMTEDLVLTKLEGMING